MLQLFPMIMTLGLFLPDEVIAALLGISFPGIHGERALIVIFPLNFCFIYSKNFPL